MEEKVTYREYDLANYINTAEDVLVGIEVAMEDNDNEFLMELLNAFVRSKNFSAIANELGISRNGLYKALSPQGNPSFVTVMNLLNILGIGLKPYARNNTNA